MNYIELLKVFIFYICLAIIVVIFPAFMDGFGAYMIIILLSLAFILISGISIHKGGVLPGTVLSILSMCSVFGILLLSGSVAQVSFNVNALAVLLSGAIFQVFVAVGEELSFRQYLFEALDKCTGPKMAAIISSAGFAALHLPSMMLLGISIELMVVAMVTIFTASIVLTLLYMYGGIFNAIAFHFFWNFLQYHVFGLGPMESPINVSLQGANLLTGGNFGPEASLPGLLVTLSALVVLWYYYVHKGPHGITGRRTGH